MDVLHRTQQDLLKGREKLDQMIEDLEREKVGILVLYNLPGVIQQVILY